MDIGTRYEPHTLENKWYKTWEENHAFEPKKRMEMESLV